jgi:iron(III) transport system ATP-binding protein
MSGLEIRGLSKAYGAVQAVAAVDLNAPTGCHTAIVGPSGSGKTTLVRLIAGFEAPDAGRIVLDGTVMADAAGTIVPAHKRQIGYLPQDGALFPHLTVAANIGFGIPGDAAARAARVSELAKMVSLDESMLERWPHQLSGGQQQRVALARALAQRPKLILLDEPFSALDTGLRAATRRATVQLLDAAGVTALLVTHDQGEALSFADQIAVMREGRMVQVGPPVDLYLHPRDVATATFLGEAIILNAAVRDGWAECSLGRVAVNGSAHGGAALVMLRPEQVHLAEAGDEHPAVGKVVEFEFVGHSCVLTVELDGMRLQVRTPILRAPAIGARVGLSVSGPAHVLPSDK